MHTDANAVGVGCVLLQHQSQAKSHIIHHMTMVLSIPQHKHTIGVMECMAIVLAPHKLCVFVDGTHFTIISDHHGLHFVKSNHTPSPLMQCWWWETSGCGCDVATVAIPFLTHLTTLMVVIDEFDMCVCVQW